MQLPAPTLRNPLTGLIPDDLYALLEKHHLLNEKGIRDYELRMRFKTLRDAAKPPPVQSGRCGGVPDRALRPTPPGAAGVNRAGAAPG